MDLNELKRLVTEGNKELPKLGLVKFSWGNVSAIDREKGIIVIKPVGMPYAELSPKTSASPTLADTSSKARNRHL